MKCFVLMMSLVMIIGLPVYGAKPMEIYDLRCEYMENPLGIDNRTPQLSWKLKSAGNDQTQTAYHILVASNAARLKKNTGDLWDSGKVDSSNETGVVYSGTSLVSGQACFWKVMVWDKDGKKSKWSKDSMWSMGLLDDRDWTAAWIGYDQPRVDAEAGYEKDKRSLLLVPARFLRKEFSIDKSVKRATLYASALGNYKMHMNGKPVGHDYFTPGWTDYRIRVYYNTYDVTRMVREGQNAIGGILADGWYAGYIGWGKGRDHYGKDPRLSAQLVLEYNDGTRAVIATDGSWKANTGPILEGEFLAGETYDARLEMDGWDKAGFNASAWKKVDVAVGIQPKIEAYPSYTVQIFQEIKPLSVSEPLKGHFVFDLGTNVAGFVRLKVKGESGEKITLRFGERLNPDGTVYTANLRSARATDTYICKGKGTEIWQPNFTFHGFQYVEMIGFPGKPGKNAITGIELTSATPVTGSFECSDSRLNQLYHNICQTQRANFIDVPTDCPQRDERLGWTGDAQAYIRTACLNADVQSFFRKWLIDLTDAQFENGDFPRFAPAVGDFVKGSGGPAWSDAGIICPWAIYEVYGDKEVLEKHYDAMVEFVEFRVKSAPDHLAPEKFNCYGDWLNINAPTPKDVIYVAYSAGDARIMAKIAAVLGRDEDVRKYNKLYKDIRQAFKTAYISEDGTIKGDTQTVYILALWFDLVDGPMREKAEQHLIERIEERDWHLSTGFVGTRDLMHVLSKIGRTDVAYRLLFTDTYPSWLFPVKNGATSIWERWDSWTPEKGFGNTEMNSFSHYTYGAVGQWMFENIGGIKSASPGYQEIVIKPYMTDQLTWAKTSYDSIHGKISVDWKRKEQEVTLKVSVPVNVKATIHVPGKPEPVEVGSGVYTFKSQI